MKNILNQLKHVHLLKKTKNPSKLKWYYGFCFSDYRNGEKVFTIIPFNWIFRFHFGFYYLIKGVKPMVWDKHLEDAFNKGFLEGVSSRVMMNHVAKELKDICGIESEITISDLRE